MTKAMIKLPKPIGSSVHNNSHGDSPLSLSRLICTAKPGITNSKSGVMNIKPYGPTSLTASLVNPNTGNAINVWHTDCDQYW